MSSLHSLHARLTRLELLDVKHSRDGTPVLPDMSDPQQRAERDRHDYSDHRTFITFTEIYRVFVDCIRRNELRILQEDTKSEITGNGVDWGQQVHIKFIILSNGQVFFIEEPSRHESDYFPGYISTVGQTNIRVHTADDILNFMQNIFDPPHMVRIQHAHRYIRNASTVSFEYMIENTTEYLRLHNIPFEDNDDVIVNRSTWPNQRGESILNINLSQDLYIRMHSTFSFRRHLGNNLLQPRTFTAYFAPLIALVKSIDPTDLNYLASRNINHIDDIKTFLDTYRKGQRIEPPP